MSETPLELGVRALQSGDAQGALQHFMNAAQRNPTDAQVQAYMGAAYAQLGQTDAAVAALRRAVNLAPTAAPLRFNLGAILERAGKRSEAEAAYDEALKLDPKYDRARQALARLAASAPTIMPQVSPPSPPTLGGGFGGPPGHGPTGGYGAPGDVTQQVPSAPPGHFGGPPAGMTPLGDWTPASPPASGYAATGPEPAGLGSGHFPPPRPATHAAEVPDARVVATRSEERGMTQSEFAGKCYLAGMGKGVWWGLIGAFFVFLFPLLSLRTAEYTALIPVFIVVSLMYVALGALLYGVAGLIGAGSDEADGACGTAGAVIGVAEAALWPVFIGFFLYTGVPQVFGCIIISRYLGRSLGETIDEWKQSALVVSGPRGVAVTHARR